MKFKVGEKVRIIGKKDGYNCLDGNPWKINDIAYVRAIQLVGTRKYFLKKFLHDNFSLIGAFDSEDLEKVLEISDFSAGDEVEILRKSVGRSLNVLELEKTVRVSSVCPITNIVNIRGDHFLPEDLRLKKGVALMEKGMRYKKLKPLFFDDIMYSHSPSKTEKNNLIVFLTDYKYKFTEDILDERLIKRAEAKPCFINWLINNKYLEDTKPVFTPFKVTLSINSVEELYSLYHRLNFSFSTIKKHYVPVTYPVKDSRANLFKEYLTQAREKLEIFKTSLVESTEEEDTSYKIYIKLISQKTEIIEELANKLKIDKHAFHCELIEYNNFKDNKIKVGKQSQKLFKLLIKEKIISQDEIEKITTHKSS